MANYERMWNSLKRELQQLEEHYSDMRLYYARKSHPFQRAWRGCSGSNHVYGFSGG